MQSQQFQKEAFEKIERPMMLGLRSPSQATRRKFFQLYHKNIPNNLFERLKFILCVQNWERLAGTFWLKQALVSGGAVRLSHVRWTAAGAEAWRTGCRTS